jgi:hypothetical protein
MSEILTIKGCMDICMGALSRYAQDQQGYAFIASDLEHAWRLAISGNTQAPKFVVVFTGQEIRGDFAVAAINHRVDSHFSLIISRGRGFNLDRGQSLVADNVNAPPLFEIVEGARDVIRSLWSQKFVESPVDFRGVNQWDTRPYITDAYNINFAIPCDLPFFAGQPNDGPNPEQTEQ